MDDLSRRTLLAAAGSAGAALTGGGALVHAQAAAAPLSPPAHRIRFGVIGLDHYHIMSMTSAVQGGAGELVAFYATDPKQIADFRKQFGDVRLARSEAEIL